MTNPSFIAVKWLRCTISPRQLQITYTLRMRFAGCCRKWAASAACIPPNWAYSFVVARGSVNGQCLVARAEISGISRFRLFLPGLQVMPTATATRHCERISLIWRIRAALAAQYLRQHPTTSIFSSSDSIGIVQRMAAVPSEERTKIPDLGEFFQIW